MRNPFKKFRNYYANDLSMQSKFIISHLLLVLIPTIVLAFAFYGQLHELIVSQTIQSEQAISEQTTSLVDTTLRQVENTSSLITNTSFFTQLFGESTNKFTAEDSRQDYTKTFMELVHSQQNSNITGIKIYVNDKSSSLYNLPATNKVFRPMGEAFGTHWHGILSSSNLETLFCPSFYLSPSEIADNGGLAHVTKIYYGDTGEIAAYCVVYFSQTNMNQIVSQSIDFQDSATYVINDRDALVASSSSQLLGVYRLPYATIPVETGGPGRYITKSIQGTDFYMGYYEVPTSGWMLVSILPIRPIVQKGNQMAMLFIVIYLLVLVLAFFVALTLSRSISRRISTLAVQMGSIRKAPHSLVQLEGHYGKDEIGDLVDTYNYMSAQIDRLLEEQSQAAKDMRFAEFQALQAQINPHFLYNSLDMINWLAKGGQMSNVSAAVQSLSKFYKLTLNKTNDLVSVQKEIDHVSLYVQLQNMRYQNKIHLYVDIPDELLKLELPNLIFQPIVENAIQHGIFEHPDKEGNIILTGWLEEDTVVFLLSDNGIGMTQKQVDFVLSGDKKKSNTKKGSNIGVYNTHHRLQFLYGPEYGLTYSSMKNVGTDVEMRIPLITP